jgi:transcriptional regulator with XRE-family HTH domain
MINENIKKYRKQKGMSQEEMAVRLNVVRQTVSKWESGLSVPDADILMQIAELLEVSVGQLLDIDTDKKEQNSLSEELARLNDQLAEKARKEKLALKANRKRGLILLLSFAAMLVALMVRNEIVSIILVGGCLLASVIILYRNLALLTRVTTDDMKIGILRLTTIFNICILAAGIIISVLTASSVIDFTENQEKMLAMLLISCVILFAGIISPKLPFSRHTGLRLPRTVQDEDTWNLAHKILGYISLPVVILYLTGALTIPYFEAVTVSAVLIWLGIPSGISYIYLRRRIKGHHTGF